MRTIDRIAREILGLETLERRNSDGIDFHDLSVWEIKRALEAAYTAGGRQQKLRNALRDLIKASDDLTSGRCKCRASRACNVPPWFPYPQTPLLFSSSRHPIGRAEKRGCHRRGNGQHGKRS